MRILIVNWTSRKVGGAEDYLIGILSALKGASHDVAFVSENDDPQTRERIRIPGDIPSWSLSELGIRRTIDEMKRWKPDIIYAHGLLSYHFERQFLRIAPSIYFAHNYYGSCISGLKTFKFPDVRPCNRKFGAGCLLHYLPRACGGRNIITMWKLYRRESLRRANLFRYGAIITHSNHMRDEYIRNGMPKSRVYSFMSPSASAVQQDTTTIAPPDYKRSSADIWNLLFVGRMDRLKGGSVLLDAIPSVAARLNRPIRVVFAGDGPERAAWESKAVQLRSQHSRLIFEFPGWLDERRLDETYKSSDLLVVPSLWPEPFGRIGVEAGLHSVPAAAFNVGGINDWLKEGINGYAAPGQLPIPGELADAIVKCLADDKAYQQLRSGALKVAQQFNLESHLEALYGAFHRVVADAA